MATAPAIKQILKITGISAAAENLSWAFASAAQNATSEIIGRYGNVTRARRTAASSRPGVSTNPGASRAITDGIIASPISTSTTSATSTVVCTSPASRIARPGPSPARTSAKLGTKALASAPSAVNRRNMLGSFSATRNASAAGPAPRKAANAISRKNPRMRLRPVRPLIRRNAAASDIGFIPLPRSPVRTPPANGCGSLRDALHYAPVARTDPSHRIHRPRVHHRSIQWPSESADQVRPAPW